MQATCGRREFSGGLSLWTTSVPKSDRSPGENEDAAAWCLQTRRFAIADGATDSAFSRAWADTLARQFVAAGSPWRGSEVADTLSEWLAPLQAAWRTSIPWDQLPWYLEEKAGLGAFTTLLGLELEPFQAEPNDGTVSLKPSAGMAAWHAVALGDSCLFHWRRDLLLTAFPLDHSTAFGNRPYLIGSQPDRNADLPGFCRRASGLCRPDDQFLLATDAIAQWLLREFEQGRWRAGELLAAEDQGSFISLISELRESEGLRNDDTTLLHIRVGHDFGGAQAAPATPAAQPAETLPGLPKP